MPGDEPWQLAEHAGSRPAHVVKSPQVLSALLKKAKRPVLIMGSLQGEDPVGRDRIMDLLVDFALTGGIPIVASGRAAMACKARNYPPSAMFPVVDAANRLTDPCWTGVLGEGPHDLVFIAGFLYGMEWTVLSGLKNSGHTLVTVSLDPYYQPQASWSVPSIRDDEWVGLMQHLIKMVQEG